ARKRQQFFQEGGILRNGLVERCIGKPFQRLSMTHKSSDHELKRLSSGVLTLDVLKRRYTGRGLPETVPLT
ncbi:MAG TPA: hypothetical protein VGQ73_04370, partial [Gemmatimonadales bacterium]|nr:hypothetical protein [Gemmatimonadales bacterium]